MKHLKLFTLILISVVMVSSCTEEFMSESTTFQYKVHNGQTIPSIPYAGTHQADFSVDMSLSSMENGNTMITATLNNTIDGAVYHMHAHDAADPSTTPNGTPYNESPNAEIFAQMITGNGGTVMVSQEAKMTYESLTTSYEGFFVVHDPNQTVSTTDISSYLVVGGFARAQSNKTYASSSFNYDFNSGQLVQDFAYQGTHSSDLSASIEVVELEENKSRIIVRINNTMNGQTYASHAHDMADPSTTANGTPYIESPNSNVFAGAISGNGGSASRSQVSTMSYEEIINNYDGFFVVHDPLQAIDTTNPTTYVVLGVFAR